jgi:hypothetical protein
LADVIGDLFGLSLALPLSGYAMVMGTGNVHASRYGPRARGWKGCGAELGVLGGASYDYPLGWKEKMQDGREG